MVPADGLYEALVGESPKSAERSSTVFVRRVGRAGRGPVAVNIQRDGGGAFAVTVRRHEQTLAELA